MKQGLRRTSPGSAELTPRFAFTTWKSGCGTRGGISAGNKFGLPRNEVHRFSNRVARRGTRKTLVTLGPTNREPRGEFLGGPFFEIEFPIGRNLFKGSPETRDPSPPGDLKLFRNGCGICAKGERS